MIGICLFHASIQAITDEYFDSRTFDLRKEVADFVENVYKRELDPKRRADLDQFLESLKNDGLDSHSSDNKDNKDNDEDDDYWDESKSLVQHIMEIITENLKWTIVRRIDLEPLMKQTTSPGIIQDEFWSRLQALGEEHRQALYKEGTIEVVDLVRHSLDKMLEIEGTLKQEVGGNPHDHMQLTQTSL
jgi:hypothetical protein